jgi:hypothetical protein
LCRSLLPKGCRANQAQLKIPDGCCQETVNYSYQLLEMLKKSLYLARSERAGNRVRTDDLLITNQLLYQLSYAGFSGGCEKEHILAFAANLCCQNATVEICFRISSVAILNHPSPRTKAERDLIQGGFATNPSASSVPSWIQVRSIGRGCFDQL